ncbi:MAG: hypothetical protein QM820_16935 [Minicystis sp.]
MDLTTLLSARRELDRGAQPIHDVAAAERALLESRAAPPGSAWIHEAVRVIAEHQRQGRGERVWPLLRELEPLVLKRSESEPANAGRIVAAIAAQALLEGDAEAFLDRAGRAAEALDRAGEAGAASIERAALGGGLLALGADELAEGALDAAIAAADAAGLAITAAAARHDRARLALQRGAFEEARTLAAAAAEGFAAIGDRRMEGAARAVLATALAKLRRGEEAITEARRSQDALAGSADQALAGAAMARALLATGQADEAVKAASGVKAGSVGWLAGGAAPAWIALADAHAAAGDASAAAAAITEAKRAVLAFASKLRSPTLRRGYLERIPDHRRALALDPA